LRAKKNVLLARRVDLDKSLARCLAVDADLFGVMRGRHDPLDRPQGKRIRCTRGADFDVKKTLSSA
jgi:hypothetical protein